MEMNVDIPMPSLSAELKVELTRKHNKNSYKWVLYVVMPPPDRRYNGALVRLFGSRYTKFVNQILEAKDNLTP